MASQTIPMCVAFVFAVCLCVVHCLRGENLVTMDDSPQAHHVFNVSDLDRDMRLTYGEFLGVFRKADNNSDGHVEFSEFMTTFRADHIEGTTQEALAIFVNLDVNKDLLLDLTHDVPYVFKWFDINLDMVVTQGEFVIQWVKISS